MARHAPALRPDPGTAFLEPKPQVALITVAVGASSYDTIHYCYKQHQECSASALLCTLRAATKRLNGTTTKRDLNAPSRFVGRRRPDRCCSASQWPCQDRASSKTARPVAHSSRATSLGNVRRSPGSARRRLVTHAVISIKLRNNRQEPCCEYNIGVIRSRPTTVDPIKKNTDRLQPTLTLYGPTWKTLRDHLYTDTKVIHIAYSYGAAATSHAFTTLHRSAPFRSAP